MIHVDDLSQFAYDLTLGEASNSSGLQIAVDHSNITQKELATALASTLGNGQVE